MSVQHTPFMRVTPEAVGIASEAIERLLNNMESTPFIEPHGLMIMRHGQVCAEGWWAPYGAGVPHTLYSSTKTYTATAVGLAYTQGLLELDDKILDYFPEYRHLDSGQYIKEMTLHDVLTMSSGKAEIRNNTAEWKKKYFEIPIKDKPGTKFEYSSEDTNICLAIVQKVTGQNFHQYLKKNLFDKIGIPAERLKWTYLPDGSEVGCGGLHATTEDSLRLMKLYLQGGVWEGERILAADYVEQAIKTHILTGNKVYPELSGNRERYYVHTGYGYQIWSDELLGAYCAAGALGQYSVVVPVLDMIISINQTTDENMRYVLGDILGILMPAAQAQPLPANPEASGRLKKRLQSLSLGNPRSLPCSDLLKEISGHRYEVSENRFTLRFALWDHLTINNPFPEPDEPLPQADRIEWFSFKYISPDVCSLCFREEGKEFALQIGMDGVRRLNTLALSHTNIDKVVLDGAWTDRNVFRLHARWIETCFSITVSFHFFDHYIEIHGDQFSGDYRRHPLRKGKVVANLCK